MKYKVFFLLLLFQHNQVFFLPLILYFHSRLNFFGWEKSPPPKNDDFDQDTRNILKNHFGMSDEELDRLDIGKGFKKDSQGANTGGDMDFKHDPLFTGMKDTSKDATNWRDFLKKASKNTNEKWEQLKNDRVDSPQNSKRYSIEEDKHGEKFVLLLLLIAASLMYNEFKYN